MKKYSVSIFLTAIILNCFLLTGCFDTTAKIKPNNWNCRQDGSSELSHRIEKLEHEGKIENTAAFIQQCQENKLGIFSDDYEKLSFSKDYVKAHDILYTKWERENLNQKNQ